MLNGPGSPMPARGIGEVERTHGGPTGRGKGTVVKRLPRSTPSLCWEVPLYIGSRLVWKRLLGESTKKGLWISAYADPVTRYKENEVAAVLAYK